jgi:hypothetical protein
MALERCMTWTVIFNLRGNGKMIKSKTSSIQ